MRGIAKIAADVNIARLGALTVTSTLGGWTTAIR